VGEQAVLDRYIDGFEDDDDYFANLGTPIDY